MIGPRGLRVAGFFLGEGEFESLGAVPKNGGGTGSIRISIRDWAGVEGYQLLAQPVFHRLTGCVPHQSQLSLPAGYGRHNMLSCCHAEKSGFLATRHGGFTIDEEATAGGDSEKAIADFESAAGGYWGSQWMFSAGIRHRLPTLSPPKLSMFR